LFFSSDSRKPINFNFIFSSQLHVATQTVAWGGDESETKGFPAACGRPDDPRIVVDDLATGSGA
jgi:hypothetical protein